MEKLVEYATFLVKSICKNPDEVTINVTEEDNQTVLEIEVPEKSMGSIIGRGGKTATSIRTMVSAYAYLHEIGRVKVNFISKEN